jgi:hypothetical protein
MPCRYLESNIKPLPILDGPARSLSNPSLAQVPIPESGPGSIRYRRLFGFDQPISWWQLQQVVADCPMVIDGLYQDQSDLSTKVVTKVGERIHITACDPTGGWTVSSTVFDRSSCSARFDFAAEPLYPKGKLHDTFIHGAFSDKTGQTVLTFTSHYGHSGQIVWDTWVRVGDACP